MAVKSEGQGFESEKGRKTDNFLNHKIGFFSFPFFSHLSSILGVQFYSFVQSAQVLRSLTIPQR